MARERKKMPKKAAIAERPEGEREEMAKIDNVIIERLDEGYKVSVRRSNVHGTSVFSKEYAAETEKAALFQVMQWLDFTGEEKSKVLRALWWEGGSRREAPEGAVSGAAAGEEGEGGCPHGRVELRGHEAPDGLPEHYLWIPDPLLACLDCGVRLMNAPEDLEAIVNIPHPPVERCKHPFSMRAYPLAGFGAWRCLCCGEAGVSSPTTKLHVREGGLGQAKSVACCFPLGKGGEVTCCEESPGQFS